MLVDTHKVKHLHWPPNLKYPYTLAWTEAARKAKGSDDEEEDEDRAREEKRNKAAGGSRWGFAPSKVWRCMHVCGSACVWVYMHVRVKGSLSPLGSLSQTNVCFILTCGTALSSMVD
eukprot:scaffold47563_cov21-Tisochrysis_lutea.AAC.1